MASKSQVQEPDLSDILKSDEEERIRELSEAFDEEDKGEGKSLGAKEGDEKKEKSAEAAPAEEEAAAEEEKKAEEKPTTKEKAEAKPSKEEAQPKKKEEESPELIQLRQQVKERDEALVAEKARTKDLQSKVNAVEVQKKRDLKFNEANKAYGEFVGQRTLKTLKDIEALSEDDAEYDNKVARIRAQEAVEIRAYERKHPELMGIFQDEEPPAEGVEKPAAKQTAAKETTATPQTEKQPLVSQEEKAGIELVQGLAKQAGLDPNDPMFVVFCQQAPETLEDGTTPMPFEKQVEWAINRTVNYQAFVSAESSSQGASRTKKKQPLGRAADVSRDATKEYKPIGIGDALDVIRQERTL